jgi:hypothetical protein
LQAANLCGSPGLSVPFDIKQNIQTVLFGLNYRFGPGWVVAKY